ncbi:cuticle protein 38-like [Cotesia glomerata]|nr:cuticle protein 38-like [Cotesia glomerata]
MYKFAVLFALVAFVTAAPEPKPGYVAVAPVLAHVAAPSASSYSNSYKVTLKSPVIQPAAYVAPAAPLTYAQPLAYAATAYAAAPLAYAHPAVAIHP